MLQSAPMFRCSRHPAIAACADLAAAVALCCIVAPAAGCGKHASAITTRPPSPVTTAPAIAAAPPVSGMPAPALPPAEATIAFSSPSNGVALRYPAEWVPRTDPDYILSLVPVAGPVVGPAGDPGAMPAGTASISLDVPELPVRIPFLITMDKVLKGFLDDLRKQHPDLQVEESVDQKVAGTTARRVRTIWQDHGRTRQQVAVLVTRGGWVYILRAGDDLDHFPRTAEAFQVLVESLHWLK